MSETAVAIVLIAFLAVGSALAAAVGILSILAISDDDNGDEAQRDTANDRKWGQP